MHILLPPSEGKSRPHDDVAPRVDIDRLVFPELADKRREMMDHLVRASGAADAQKVLKVGAKVADEIQANRDLPEVAAAPAHRVYTGVLFDALDFASLSAQAQAKAGQQVLVFSALYGVVRLADVISPYRMSAMARIPEVGNPATWWRPELTPELDEAVQGVVIDCRSQSYAGFWRAPAQRSATVKVLQPVNGELKVVSHHAKYTRGLVARALVQAPSEPETLDEVVDVLRAWSAEQDLRWKAKLVSAQSGSAAKSAKTEIQVIVPEAQ